MKITSLRIDGYGVLSNVSIDRINPKLTVVFGPNEAGKSTLLDFVRGILFGFPDRRKNQPFHAPLRGGRHGGGLGLVDENDGEWFIERYVGERNVALSGPDGSLAPDVFLEKLLGGADETLFRSVFAFGLTELSALESLDRDEVQELVFSAGVLGAGRSATRAVRNLEDRQGLLVRPRQQGAVANRLLQELDVIETALRTAQDGAVGFADAQLARDQLNVQLAGLRFEIDVDRRRIGELERIEACWPTWRKREDSTIKLGALGQGSSSMSYALEHAGILRDLVVRFSGHSERLRRRNELGLQSGGIERELKARLDDIGGVDVDNFDRFADIPLDVRDEIQTLAGRHHELVAELHVLGAEADNAAEHAIRAQGELKAAKNIERDTSIVSKDVSAVRDLRRLMQHRDRTQGELLSEVREIRLLDIENRRTGRNKQPVFLYLFSAAAIALGTASALLTSRHIPIAAMSCLVLMVAAIIGVISITSRRATHFELSPNPLLERQKEELSRLNEDIEHRSMSLGLEAKSNLAEIELLEAQLDNELFAAQARAEIERRAVDATDQAARARQPVTERNVEMEAITGRTRALCRDLGLASSLSPEGLALAAANLVRARELSRARQRVQNEIAELDLGLRRYEAELNCSLDALVENGQHRNESVEQQIVLLNEILDNAVSFDQQREKLALSIESADEILRDTLGSDATADRLVDELSSGATTTWTDERTRLNVGLQELTSRYDELLSKRRDAERHLEDLMQSDEIARLELQYNSVQSDLDDALIDYVTLGLARNLLSSTLTRYEQERQPAVIARAAELFKMITDERYVRIVAHPEEEGRRQNIETITHAGERISSAELSRGSAEQLYFCLRLALAEAFAERAVPLPFVLDDILVNFDPSRAQAVAAVIAEVATHHQTIAFTCHPHVVDLFSAAQPGVQVINLPSTERT